MTRTIITDDSGLFPYYLHYEIEAFGPNTGATDTQIRLRDTNGSFGFKGSISAGAVYLLHLILRSTPDIEAPLKFHMSIYGEGSSTQYVSTSGHPQDFFSKNSPQPIPTQWTEYYIPLQAHSIYAPDKVLFFLNPKGGTGSVDIACMEITNHGKEVNSQPYS